MAEPTHIDEPGSQHLPPGDLDANTACLAALDKVHRYGEHRRQEPVGAGD